MSDVPISPPRVVVTRPKSAAINAGAPHAPSSPSRPVRPSTGSASGRLLVPRRDSRESSSSGMSSAGDLPLQPPDPAASATTADTTGNVYHAMVARRQAEEKAAQLARRMAFYREQEERVLREVKAAKSQLERCLMTPQQPRAQSASCTRSTNRSPMLLSAKNQHVRACSPTKSREQRQFLTKQRRILQMRRHESARIDKEKRQAALEAQRARDLAKDQTKHLQMERIRREQQHALEHRAAQQRQLLVSLESHHLERLEMERQREKQAIAVLESMQQEEKNITLRLQALRFHQQCMQQALH